MSEFSRRKAWKRARPNRLLIASMTWQICYDAHKLDAAVATDDGHHHGLCNRVNATIYVRGTDPVGVQRDTLVHETLHAISATYGVEWVKDEERMVTRLAPLLLQVLRDNPGLVRAVVADGGFNVVPVRPS